MGLMLLIEPSSPGFTALRTSLHQDLYRWAPPSLISPVYCCGETPHPVLYPTRIWGSTKSLTTLINFCETQNSRWEAGSNHTIFLLCTVVARAYGHRLLPQPPHRSRWLIGSYIDGHHLARLTGVRYNLPPMMATEPSSERENRLRHATY